MQVLTLRFQPIVCFSGKFCTFFNGEGFWSLCGFEFGGFCFACADPVATAPLVRNLDCATDESRVSRSYLLPDLIPVSATFCLCNFRPVSHSELWISHLWNGTSQNTLPQNILWEQKKNMLRAPFPVHGADTMRAFLVPLKVIITLIIFKEIMLCWAW